MFLYIDKAFLFLKLSEPSSFLLIHGQNSHPAGSVKIALQSMKSQGFFCSGGWQPCFKSGINFRSHRHLDLNVFGIARFILRRIVIFWYRLFS